LKFLSTVEFVKAPRKKDPIFEKSEQLQDLNENVFTYAITRDIDADIRTDSTRKEDNIILFGLPTLCNGRQEKDRHIEDHGGIEDYINSSFGSMVQLALGLPQAAAVYEAGEHINILSPILNENTKNTVINGFFTPTSKNIDQVIEQLKTKSELIEYPCIISEG